MGRTNPWLAEKLKGLKSPLTLNLIVEVEDPARLAEVRQALAAISGVSVGPTAFNMVRASAPPGVVPQIAATPGVIVHYDAPVTIRAAPSILDPLVGKFSASPVEIPFTPQEMAARLGPNLVVGLATLPFRLAQQFLGIRTPFGEVKEPGVIIIPTGALMEMLEVPEDNKMTQTKVAVLDTGLSYPHPLLHISKGLIKLGTFAGIVPFDGLGHGQWVATAAFGDSFKTRFGLCKGVADPENGTLGAWKVLSDIGFGSEFSIIQGIEAAYKWGAKVINMSLGGELQGSVRDDPECRIIEQLKDKVIFVVAAGNSGPDEWTIGTPAASPFAVTVGAWSPQYDGLAVFSSRGPSASWYRDHPEDWRRDRATYGENNMLKPDLVAPGGGPVKEGDPMDLLYSGCLAQGTLIYTPQGPVPIEQIQPGDEVYSVSEEAPCGLRVHRCTEVIPKGLQPTLRIVARGMEVYATRDHGFLRLRKEGPRGRWKRVDLEWVPASSLEPGDSLVTFRRALEKCNELDGLLTEKQSRSLGYLTGDGWVSRRGHVVALAPGNQRTQEVDLFEEAFGVGLHDYPGKTGLECKVQDKRLWMILTLLGFNQGHKDIALPSWLFGLSHLKVRAFLEGLYAADGDHHERRLSMGFGLASLPLVRGMQALARYSGWSASNIYRRPNPGGFQNYHPTVQLDIYRIQLTPDAPDGHDRTDHRLISYENLRYATLGRVKSGPTLPVYDINVEETHNFIAEGLVVHNCVGWTDSMYDLTPLDGFAPFRGTSMATPLAAGLIALAVERGLVKTARDVKDRMARSRTKNHLVGYGAIRWSKLLP